MNNTVSHARIELVPGKEGILQVEGSDASVKIRLLTQESAWVGELKDQEIRSYCKKYGFEYTFYVENMDAAFKNSSENFIFALDGDVFRWKRRLGAGTQQVARLGEVKMIQVDQIDAFQTALNKSLETLCSFEEKLKKLQTENKTLKKERDTALEKVTEFAQLKCEWEKKLYGQFVAVLNSKKERIQALEEMLDLNLSDKAPSTDGAKQQGHSLEDQVEDEASEEDPFAGDTDVDSDVDGDVTLEKASVSCAPSTSRLRRSRDLFASSFDESDMPNSPPALPKRARASKTCTASSSSSSTVTARKVVPRENLEDDQDDMRTAESTQDLISQM